MRNLSLHLDTLAAQIISLRQARDDDIWFLYLRQLLRIDLRLAPHVHQAVRFPVNVSKLRDDVTLNRSVAAHLFNLMLERDELMPLGFSGQLVVVAEKTIEAKLFEAVEEARGSGYFASGEVALEPPGQTFRQDGQAPVAELRDNQRLLPGALGATVLCESPLRSRRKISDPSVPLLVMIGDGEVLMKIVNVRTDAKVVAGRAVFHVPTAQRPSQLFRPIKCRSQPLSLLRLLEVCAP